jgi:polysaccharide transporter, PST family
MMREWLRKLLRHGLVRNIFVLSWMQAASYLFPLATIPYLTRVLGPTAWGLVAVAWAFGNYITLFVEFGFNYTMTREVALYRGVRDKMADLLAGTLGAKALLATLAVGLALVVRRWVPSFAGHPILFWSAIFWSLAQASNMIWYYQGLERMRLVATLDISARALATAAIFLLVSSPEDGWKVLALQGLASCLSTTVALGLAYREVPLRFPAPSLIRNVLWTSWEMFVARSATSTYTAGGAFILGFFASPQLVGYYAGAEKIIRAVVGLFYPVMQAVYPRLSYLSHHARTEAVRLVRVVLAVMGIGGTLMGLLTFLLAPFLVRTMLGEEYIPAASVLRVLALLPPLIAVSAALGIQWMLPLRLERLFNAITLGAGLLYLGLALVLAPLYADVGMACAVVVAELFVTVGVYATLRWRGLDPLGHVDSAKGNGSKA